MCLISKNKDPFYAEEDIKCYKIYMIADATLTSPFMDVDYTDDISEKRVIEAKGEKTVMPLTRLFFRKDTYEVSKGFIHSYSKERKGLKLLKKWYLILDDHSYRKPIVFSCIIPKGSIYYVGRDGDYCSDNLKVLKPTPRKEMEVISKQRLWFWQR